MLVMYKPFIYTKITNLQKVNVACGPSKDSINVVSSVLAQKVLQVTCLAWALQDVFTAPVQVLTTWKKLHDH